MKTAFIAMMLLSSASTFAEAANLSQLRDLCVPSAPLVTLAAIVSAESGGNPNALQLDFPHSLLRRWRLAPGTLRLMRQPNSATEALEWINYLNARRVSVDVGLMQVSTDEATRRHISPATLLDPCTNVRTGWAILSDDYRIEVRTYGPGQAALQHALSRYNTGDTKRGIENGYLAHVMEALKRLPACPIRTNSEIPSTQEVRSDRARRSHLSKHDCTFVQVRDHRTWNDQSGCYRFDHF